MTRLPPSSPRCAKLATAAMPALTPKLRALARSMGVDPNAAIAEGWIAAHCRARRGFNPTEHMGWILTAARRALRREWVGDSTDELRMEALLSSAGWIPWAVGSEDPLVALLSDTSSDGWHQPALLDDTRAKALAMANRAQVSDSPRTKRYWRARAWAVLASIGITDTP